MDLTQLDKRMQALEERLASLESKLVPIVVESQQVIKPEPVLLPPPKKIINKQGNWLGFIAVICFVLAAGFIVKLALESGWLTPERQIVLSYFFGAMLIAAGFIIFYIDKPYASLLPAAGVIILYLTTFAAYRLYFLLSFHAALGLTSFVSGLCIWLYLRIRHDIFSIVAALGVYLAPLVLDIRADAQFSLFFFLICSCTFATISIWVESRTLTVISAYLAILVTGVIGLSLQQDQFVAIVLALHFLVFAVGTYFYSQQTKKPLTEREAWAFFPVLVIFYAMEYFYLDRAYPGYAPLVSIIFALVLIGLYSSARKWFSEQLTSSQSLIMAFSTLVFFHSVYLELLTPILRAWLLVIILIVFALIPIKSIIKNRNFAYVIPALAIMTIVVIEYFTILMNAGTGFDWLLAAIAAFASFWVLLIMQHDFIKTKDDYSWLILAAAHVLGITVLYQVVSGSLAVSTCWLLYALVVIGCAFIRKDKIMAKSALIILSAAAAKALLYDTASTAPLVRIACLLLTGIVLYSCGLLIRRVANWHSEP